MEVSAHKTMTNMKTAAGVGKAMPVEGRNKGDIYIKLVISAGYK